MKQLDLESDQNEIKTEKAFIEYAIRKRLEMVGPYIRSQRWAEGMALGASPFQVQETAKHLEAIVSIIEENLSIYFKDVSISLLDRGGIGTIYIATELHMLADSSTNYEDTWMFLNQRMMDLEQITKSTQSGIPTSDTLVAAQAVASSLGGAFLSLMAPAAQKTVSAVAGAVVPKVMDMMPGKDEKHVNIPTRQSGDGTQIEDYELPSFEGEKPIQLK